MVDISRPISGGDRGPLRWTRMLGLFGVTASIAVAFVVMLRAPSPGRIEAAPVAPVGEVSTAAVVSQSLPAEVGSSTVADRRSKPGGGHAPAAAMWPWPEFAIRYEDPRSAARAFAEDLLGFEHPLIGSFRPLGADSGEVDLQGRRDGPLTRVIVEQASDGSWWVLESMAENVVVDEPVAGQVIGDTIRVSGRAWAESETVEIEVRADRSTKPLHRESFTTGGGDEPFGFEAQFGWDGRDGGHGAIILLTRNVESGLIEEASAVKVGFTAQGPVPSIDGNG